ncbi:hypothetical protein [Ralstonia sp. ASV6]|uniref:hypothetical protein n=1 Tax=Ralstonia sp. ASV6 TaxID=2795124 RepID=UPI0018EAAD31|nr:hypothetical protein [Ralstonia sp. ASV6]
MFPTEYWMVGVFILAVIALIDFKFAVLLGMIAAGVLAILHAKVDLGMSWGEMNHAVRDDALPQLGGLLILVLMPVVAKMAHQIYWVRRHVSQEEKPVQ